MNVKQYREFVLVADGVEKDKDGLRQFTVQASSFTAGDSPKEVRPVPADLRAQLNRLERRLLEMGEIIALGEALADLLLPDKARGLFIRSLDKLQQDQGLRLRLRLEPVLAEYNDKPFWVLEYAGACWNSPPYTFNTETMQQVTAFFKDTSWITRYAWFSNRIRGTEPWGPNHQSCSLVDPDTGVLTSLGVLYAGY